MNCIKLTLIDQERGGKGISSSSLWRENKKNAKKIKVSILVAVVVTSSLNSFRVVHQW